MMTEMKGETYGGPPGEANAFATLRRAALVALCALLGRGSRHRRALQDLQVFQG
jgi:hypothetical protein